MKDRIRIVCIGDSLTEGYEIYSDMRWTDLLSDEYGLDIINAGISGDTTAGMLARFHPMVITHHPSHVIILGGTNDLWYGIPTELIISNILSMTKMARHHSIISIIGLPTLFYPQIGGAFSNIFLDAQAFLENLIHFRAKLDEVARSKDLRVIDFSKNLTSVMYLDDGIHPNEIGHQQMKENAKEILELIL